MSKTQAVKLILENLSMIEEIEKFIEDELTVTLFKNIDKIVKEEFNYWSGTFNYWEDGLVFYPRNWEFRNIDNIWEKSISYYYLNRMDNEDAYYIRGLFGIKGGKFEFIFYTNYKSEEFKFNKKEWRDFCRKENEKYPQIQQAGFKFNEKDGNWYLPIQPLDIHKVIECYESDLDEAMEPIHDACRILLEAHTHFEKIMEDAKSYKG